MCLCGEIKNATCLVLELLNIPQSTPYAIGLGNYNSSSFPLCSQRRETKAESECEMKSKSVPSHAQIKAAAKSTKKIWGLGTF